MKSPGLSAIFGILLISWAGASYVNAQAVLRVTEVMSSSGPGGTADWFEITNYGNAAADITGYKMDDNSFSSSSAVTLSGVTTIAPGESVIFVETATPLTDLPAFRIFWGLPAAVQVGSYTGSGVSLGSGGDGVVVYTGSNVEINRIQATGAATTGSSFYYVYNSSGALLSTGNPVSAEGTVGAFKSVNALGNIGSPGASASSLELAFTSSLNKFAKVGQTYSSPITFQKKNGTDVATLSIVSGPAWLTLSSISQSGATLTGTPSVTQTGPQTITLRLSVVGQTTVELTGIITAFNTQPKVVLNEYNAVSGTSLHASLDGDLRLGRIEGNGGDWFELVVRGAGFGTTLDMRGWKIQVSQVTGGARLADTITLSQNNFWAAVPAGMILTFTEDNLAEGGYDTALNADNRLSSAKYSWSNIWLGDSALIASVAGDSTAGIGTTSSGISISGDDTQIAVLNASNGYEFGPVGEGTWRYPEVNSTSNFYLSIDPGGVVDPTLVQADSRYSAIYFGKDPAVVSTFGLPNIGTAGIQPFFGVNPPYLASRPWRFAREGQLTLATTDYRQNENHSMTFEVRGKAGASLPSWITVTPGGLFADIDLAPALGDAGIYELELVLTDTVTSVQTVESYTVVVLPATSEVLVNEFNAVSSLNRLNGGVIPVPADGDGVDTFFGTVDGNGGDWLELVVVGNGSAGTTDLRGWKIEIDDGAGSKFVADEIIVLSQDPYWAAVPNGTILTITEKTSAEGGLDTWIHKVNRLGQAGGSAAGNGAYAWSNIHYLDPVYIDQTVSTFGDGLGISSNNTQIRILKPRSGTAGQFDVVAGPVGEGVQPLAGVNNTEVWELEIDPTPSVTPYLPDVVTDTTTFIYDDGNGSTFGSPNTFTGGTQAQNFSAFKTASSAPTFSNQPDKYAVEGVSYTWTAVTADAENSSVTVTKVSGPTWLSVSGKTLSGTPAQGSAGFYDVELSASDGSTTTPLKFRLTVFNNDPSMILNEYNAVDNSGTTLTYLDGGTQAQDSVGGTASDLYFGRVAGNGGDWVEFVVTGSGSAGTTDLRGYTIEIDEGASSGYFAAKIRIKLSQNSFWAAVPNGTILTFTESSTAQGGMDTNLTAANNSTTTGSRWANVWIGDSSLITYTDLLTNGYSITAGVVSGISIDDTETQFRILNSSNYPIFGPSGEGIAPLNKISNTDVLELEGNPTATVLPTDRSDDTVTPPKNGYDNSSKDSTFGAPNQWHLGSGGVLTTQDFTPYKSTLVTDGYAQYLASKGLAAGTAFDARVNGVQVGLMYAFGTATGSPANNGVVAVPTMSGNTMTYVFDIKNDSAIGVTYQTSTDLVNWSVAQPVGTNSGTSPTGFLKKQVQVSGSGKLFIKLNVTR